MHPLCKKKIYFFTIHFQLFSVTGPWFTVKYSAGITFSSRPGLFQCTVIGGGPLKLRPHTKKCLNGALGHHEPPELLHSTIWNVKVVRHVVSRLSAVLRMVETGDDRCQRDTRAFHTYQTLRGLSSIFQSSEDRQKCDHPDSRHLPAKRPNGEPCPDRSPEQFWHEASLWGKVLGANWFLLMCDTHEVNHWFGTRRTMNHLNIQVFFFFYSSLNLCFHSRTTCCVKEGVYV